MKDGLKKACCGAFRFLNTPPAQAGGFRCRLKAGLFGHAADHPLCQVWEGSGNRIQSDRGDLTTPQIQRVAVKRSGGEWRGRGEFGRVEALDDQPFTPSRIGDFD